MLFALSQAPLASAEPAERQFLLSSVFSQPVVRVMAMPSAAKETYRHGSGVLVGRCNLLLTARHVAAAGDSVTVYSPQLYGREVTGVHDPDMAQFQPKAKPALDGDIALLRLSACPTEAYVPIEQIAPLKIAHLPNLVSVGFPCDARHRRAPETVRLEGRFSPLRLDNGVSSAVLLQPGVRQGQSGGPVYSQNAAGAIELHMIMVAVLRDSAAPIGCGAKGEAGQVAPAIATFGALLTQEIIFKIAAAIRYLGQ